MLDREGQGPKPFPTTKAFHAETPAEIHWLINHATKIHDSLFFIAPTTPTYFSLSNFVLSWQKLLIDFFSD